MPAKKKSKRIMVRESNALIDGCHNLNLSQMKMFLIILGEVYRGGKKPLKEYKTFISDLIGIELPRKKGRPSKLSLINEYKTARSIVRSLQKKLITIPLDKGEGIGPYDVQLIGGVHYPPRAGYFTFKVDADLIPHILDLNARYSKYDILNCLPCKSIHSIRLYQILKSYSGLGERVIPLDELKEMLNVQGKYRLYADFRRYVLLRAQKELKKVSDLFFTFKEIRKGKKVYSIHFIIKLKGQMNMFKGNGSYRPAEAALEDAEKVEVVQYGEWVK